MHHGKNHNQRHHQTERSSQAWDRAENGAATDKFKSSKHAAKCRRQWQSLKPLVRPLAALACGIGFEWSGWLPFSTAGGATMMPNESPITPAITTNRLQKSAKVPSRQHTSHPNNNLTSSRTAQKSSRPFTRPKVHRAAIVPALLQTQHTKAC